MNQKFQLSALAVAASLFAVACADPTSPTRTLVDGEVAEAVIPHPIQFVNGGTFPTGVNGGDVFVCKTANAMGTFNFTWTKDGVSQGAIPGGSLSVTTPGTPACRKVHTSHVDNTSLQGYETIVITEVDDQASSWALTNRDVDQYYGAFVNYPAPRLSDADDTGARSVTVYANDDMAKVATFTNFFTAPPTPICDFITFGRLVLESGGKKVVVSGNAGGFNANLSIKGEFHVEVGNVDNHVANIATYGPITSGVFSGPNFPNARMVTGTAKNGVAVELRLWDGGEPGKGTDWVYVKLGPNGTEPLGAAGKTIDQGNMQYHPVCRGPDPLSASTSSTGKKK